MILVITGTNGAPFDRLLAQVDRLEGAEPVVVQHGPSEIRPRGAECIAYLPFDDLVDRIRQARVVVTHGGVGTVLLTLMNERKPIVVPRLARFGEAVDDHQLPFARRLEERGSIVCLPDLGRLPETVAAAAGEWQPADRPGARGLGRELERYLRGMAA